MIKEISLSLFYHNRQCRLFVFSISESRRSFYYLRVICCYFGARFQVAALTTRCQGK